MKVFAAVKERVPEAVLFLVGEGSLQEDIRKQVDALGLTDAVVFAGLSNEVPKLLSGMDAVAHGNEDALDDRAFQGLHDDGRVVGDDAPPGEANPHVALEKRDVPRMQHGIGTVQLHHGHFPRGVSGLAGARLHFPALLGVARHTPTFQKHRGVVDFDFDERLRRIGGIGGIVRDAHLGSGEGGSLVEGQCRR